MNRFVVVAFAAVTLASLTAGCAAETTSNDIGEDSAELSSRARPLKEGSYSAETLYLREGTQAGQFFNPARPQPNYRPQVSDVSSLGFKLEFRSPDGGSAGLIPVNCTISGKAFVCDDVMREGSPPGLLVDGRHIPADWEPPRAFEASVYQRNKYTGVIVSKNEFITTETVTTTCEGEAAECAALAEFVWPGASPLQTSPMLLIQRQVLIAP